MKGAVAAVIAVLCAGIGLCFTSPFPERYLHSGQIVTLVYTLVVVVVGFAMLRVRGQPAQRSGWKWGSVVVLAMAAFLLELCVVALVPVRVVAELGYYCVLVAVAVFMRARWGVPVAGPVLVALGILVAITTAGALRFGLDPIAMHEYGPERWLFAIWGAGGRLTMAPLDAAVAWAAAVTTGDRA